MYLYERIIGIGTYLVALIITCLLIKKSNNKSLSKILFAYTVMLTIIAFFFYPPTGADLYRLNIIMKEYTLNEVPEIIMYAKKSFSPLSVLYMYAIGKTNINGLLPAITTFIFYSNIFYILKKSTYISKTTPKNLSILLVFIMSTSTFFEVISGIRTMLAFSIIARCFFEEIVENKNIIKNIILYIIAALLHPIAIAVIIIRILFLIIQTDNKKKKVINIALTVLIIAISLIFAQKYITGMMDQAVLYLSTREFSYSWEYIIGGLTLLYIIEIQYIYKKYIRNKKQKNGFDNVYRFSIILNVIILALSFEYNIFHRLVILNSIIIIPIYIKVIKYLISDRKKINYYKFFTILNMIILIIECSRGNLSSLKFFEF